MKKYLESERLWLWAFFPSTIDFTKTFSELDVQRPTHSVRMRKSKNREKAFSLHRTLLLKHLCTPFPDKVICPRTSVEPAITKKN